MRVVLQQPLPVEPMDRTARMSNSLMPTANELQTEIGTLPVVPTPKAALRRMERKPEKQKESQPFQVKLEPGEDGEQEQPGDEEEAAEENATGGEEKADAEFDWQDSDNELGSGFEQEDGMDTAEKLNVRL